MPKLKAVFYGRFSSKMQTENSIEGQRRVVEAYAMREGINIVGEYVDRAKSGKNAKRDSFQQMIEDIENHTIDINMVIVYKLDRFARNEDLHREYEKILNKYGVFLISATEPVNEKELASKIIKSLTLTINEEEVKKISQNVARGKKEIAYKGLWCGGTPPLGYDVDRDTQTLIINEKEAKAVKLAFKLRAQGFSYSYITEQLNRRGYKTKLGNTFGKNSLYEIYNNIKYKGVYEYNRAAAKSANGKFNRHASKNKDEIIQIKDGCPRIVSDKVWDKVNAMSIKRSGIKPKGDYLLSGLVVCKCGTTMQVNRRNNHGKDYISFFCPKHKNKEGCDAKEINMETLEEFVLLQLRGIVFEKNRIEQLSCDLSSLDEKRAKSTKRKIKELKATIRQNKQKIINCFIRIEDGCPKPIAQQYEERITELTATNTRLNKQLNGIQKELTEVPTEDELLNAKHSFISYMSSTVNLPQRKAYLQSLIKKITVDDDKVEIIFNL